jgi:hypothetical protein
MLALNIATEVGAVNPSDPPPAVIALAGRLAADAAASGRNLSPWSRSPRAVALKLNALLRGIADERYRQRLGEVAATLLSACKSGCSALDDATKVATQCMDPDDARSHGPVPVIGEVSAVRTDADARLYAVVLTGSPGAMATVAAVGRRLFKVGRSNDLERRIGELNSGLPHILGLRWKVFGMSSAMDLMEAHRAEQSLLDSIEAAGLSAGGEFARCDPRRFASILAEFGVQTTMRPAADATRDSTDRVMPGPGQNDRSRSGRPPSAPVGPSIADSRKWPSSGRPMPASHRP